MKYTKTQILGLMGQVGQRLNLEPFGCLTPISDGLNYLRFDDEENFILPSRIEGDKRFGAMAHFREAIIEGYGYRIQPMIDFDHKMVFISVIFDMSLINKIDINPLRVNIKTCINKVYELLPNLKAYYEV